MKIPKTIKTLTSLLVAFAFIFSSAALNLAPVFASSPVNVTDYGEIEHYFKSTTNNNEIAAHDYRINLGGETIFITCIDQRNYSAPESKTVFADDAYIFTDEGGKIRYQWASDGHPMLSSLPKALTTRTGTASLTEKDNLAFSAGINKGLDLYSKGKITLTQMQYIRTIAFRAYAIYRFGTEVGWGLQLCDFKGCSEPTIDSDGCARIGIVKAVNPAYNALLGYAGEIFDVMTKTWFDGAIKLDYPTQVEFTVDESTHTGSIGLTFSEPEYIEGWEINPDCLQTLNAQGIALSRTSGTTADTSVTMTNLPPHFSGSIIIDTFTTKMRGNDLKLVSHPTSQIQVYVGSSVNSVVPLQLESMEKSPKTSGGASPGGSGTGAKKPQIPKIVVSADKIDLEPGFDGSVSTPRGDGSLAATIQVYVDGIYKTSFTAGGSATIEAWDESEITENILADDPDCNNPLEVEYTAPTKTIMLTEVPPAGYLSEPQSGTGTGSRSYTVSYYAHADVTHPTHVTHEEDDGHGHMIEVFDECPGAPDSLDYDFTYQVTPDTSPTSSTSARIQHTETFINRIRKGQLIIVKEYEKDLDPFTSIPGVKDPMPNALFTILLTGGGSEGVPYLRAVEVPSSDPMYSPYYNTYRVVNDTSGTLYDGSTEATSFKTNEHGQIRILNLPYGNYTIKELAAEVPGYVLETTNVSVLDDTIYGPDTFKSYQSKEIVDYVIRNDVSIEKVDQDTGKRIPQANASFRIRYMGNPNTPVASRPSDPDYGRYLTRPTGVGGSGYSYVFTTDANGKITLPYELQYGCYQLEEILAPEGYYLGAYDITGHGSDASDTLDYSSTVEIYNASGVRLEYTVDVSDLPMTIHEFEITTMGPSAAESPKITIYAKNNTVKGKIEITKLGEELAGFKKETTEYGDKYSPIYEKTRLDGAVFDIYAATDIKIPDGIDSPLFVDYAGSPIELDRTLLDHALVPNAQSIEQKVMPDGTELLTVMERYPDDPSAMAHSTLLTALDKPNHLALEATGDTLNPNDTKYTINADFEHSPLSNGYLYYDIVKDVTFDKIGSGTVPVTVPEVTDVATGEVKNTLSDMFSDVFSNDDILKISAEESWEYVKKATEPLMLTLPMHFEIPYSLDTRYVFTDSPVTGYYIAVWTDETHTTQQWVKVYDSEKRFTKYIRPDLEPTEAVEATYIIPKTYEIVDATIDPLDSLVTTPAGFILDDVTYTDKYVWVDENTLFPEYIACYKNSADHSEGMELVECDIMLIPQKDFSNEPESTEFSAQVSAISPDGGITFLDPADFTLDTVKAHDTVDPKFVYEDSLGNRVVAANDGTLKFYLAYSGDMAFKNIPDANPGYELVPYWLKDQNAEGYNYIFFEDSVNGVYQIAATDAGGTTQIVDCSDKGEYFERAITKFKGQLVSIGDNTGDIKLDLDGGKVVLETASDSLGSTVTITSDGTVTSKELAPTTTETIAAGTYIYGLETTKPTVYMKLNDGTKIGIIYSGGFTFATIDIPYGNELPTVKIAGIAQPLDVDAIGTVLDPAHPKLNILGTDATQTQIFSEIQFDSYLLGTVEKTIVTIAKKDDGKTFEFEMPDGREMTVSLVYDTVNDTTRGEVDVTCFTPTYRYLLGDLVDTITTGVDTELLSDTAGKAVSKLLPLGSYIVRERKSGKGHVVDDTDYPVTLSYAGQYVPLVWQNVAADNERVKLKVSLEKLFETAYDSGVYVPKAGAVFGLFADETITATTVTTDPLKDTDSVEQGFLMGLMTVGADGIAKEITDVPFGHYYVQELKTLPGYVLNEAKYPFLFDETVVSSPTTFSDDVSGFSGEVRFHSEEPSVIKIDILKRFPEVAIKVNGLSFATEADVPYTLAGNAAVIGKNVGGRYELTITKAGDEEIAIEIDGKKMIYSEDLDALSYEFFAETGITPVAGADAGSAAGTKDIDSVTYTGSTVTYKAGAENTGYSAHLTSIYSDLRPEITLLNGVKAGYILDSGSGKNGGYIVLPDGITVDTGLTTETVPCADFSVSGTVYLQLATLDQSIIVLSDGTTIKYEKVGSDIVLTASDSDIEKVECEYQPITDGLTESGDMVETVGGDRVVTYMDRELELEDYLAAHGISLKALKDNTRLYIDFTVLPIGLYIDGAAETPVMSTFIDRGKTLSAVLASGITFDLTFKTDGTIEAGVAGNVPGIIADTDRAKMTNHGGSFIDKSGTPIDTQILGLNALSKDNVTLQYGENLTYRRADSSSNVIEVKINAVASTVSPNEMTSILNRLPKPTPVAPSIPYTPVYYPAPVPKIGTSAKDSATQSRNSYANGDVTIVDTVSYSGLTGGKNYTLYGIVVEKETGMPLLADGLTVSAIKEFIPADSDGYEEMEFTFCADALAGKSVVVFESLFEGGIGSVNVFSDDPIAKHHDINDENQTIQFVEPEITKEEDKPSETITTEEIIKRPQTGFETVMDFLVYRLTEITGLFHLVLIKL